ncbi:hypothetical protein RF55_10139 [Lasius niger]|uniref:Uncharacterized protein n=1 Tax=Lasius niger TaxID=67767 RepID=A0A0J7KIR0_LASNI|nr:hypothetical protein RF55_10139 [Lasius niger]
MTITTRVPRDCDDADTGRDKGLAQQVAKLKSENARLHVEAKLHRIRLKALGEGSEKDGGEKPGPSSVGPKEGEVPDPRDTPLPPDEEMEVDVAGAEHTLVVGRPPVLRPPIKGRIGALEDYPQGINSPGDRRRFDELSSTIQLLLVVPKTKAGGGGTKKGKGKRKRAEQEGATAKAAPEKEPKQAAIAVVLEKASQKTVTSAPRPSSQDATWAKVVGRKKKKRSAGAEKPTPPPPQQSGQRKAASPPLTERRKEKAAVAPGGGKRRA